MEMQTGVINSYPLSPIQQGMLFHTISDPHSGVDIEQIILTLYEQLNIPKFKQSWQQVVQRHPILRTSFDWQKNNEPFQLVHSEVKLPIAQQDWSNLSNSEQQIQLENYLKIDRKQGFQLNQAPLLRLAIFKLGESKYKCIWTFHHALMDGRAFPIILREVFAFYDAFCQNSDLKLEEPRPYQDYIEWLQQQDFGKAEEFWRQFLRGFTTPTSLPVEKAILSDKNQKDSNKQESNFAEQEIRLSIAITSELQSLAQANQLTINTLVQGAWALLLSRYTGETDIVFGATKTCRKSTISGAESMVGLLINTLPIRVNVLPEMPLIPWLKQLRSQWISLREYEHTPLVNIQGWSELPKATSLFNNILVFENYLLNSTLRSAGGRWENLKIDLVEQTNYPLTLIGYLESELLLKIKYDQSRFDDATIARMLGHLKSLLESQAANPYQCLGELPLLAANERYQMLGEWNNTQADYLVNTCIPDLFEAQVERSPNAVAVVFGDTQLTYQELNAKANKIAHHLQTLGVKPETLVGICVERSLEMVIGLLGIIKTGAAYVPLDPTYPQERLAFMLEDTQVSVLLIQQHLINIIPQHKAKIVNLDTDWQKIEQNSSENPCINLTPANLAYVIYTSGSTGKPKGVMVEHQAICHQLLWRKETFKLNQNDRILQTIPLAFDPSVWQIFGTLIAGSTLVVAPPKAHQDSSEIIKLVAKYKVTILDFVPSMLKVFLEEPDLENCASLKHVFCGGEPLPASLIEQFQTRLSATISNQYGPTEACIDTTFWKSDTGVCDKQICPIGRPIANKQVYILDSNLQPVPIGVPGELYIGGSLARGYFNRPDLTAERFIPNFFEQNLTPIGVKSATRLYKTGDLVRYLPDGNIEFLGRIDNQVKIRGFRIELGEIEAVLNQHQDVLENVVIPREDISGNKCLVAYIVLNQNTSISISQLREFVKEKLPYYMVPSAFLFLDSLPLTPNGKVDRKALPVPDYLSQQTEENFVAPRDQLEIELTQIWEKVLGIQPIGIKHNFFDLGGHSLLALRLFHRIENKFGKNLPVTTIFKAATIEEQAKLLRSPQLSLAFSSLVALQPNGTKPPFFWVPPAATTVLRYTDLAHHLGSDQPSYGLQHRGLDGKQPPLNRIEDMASEYLKEIQILQPQGPYFLGGQCAFGCLVAFEIAQQLKAQGQEVALLAFLDPRHEIFLNSNPKDSNSEKFRTSGNAIESINPLKPKSFYVRRLFYLWQNRQFFNHIWQKIQKKINYLFNPEARYVELVNKAHLEAIWYYKPRVYPGRITIFQSRFRASKKEYQEWSWVATEGLDFYTILGSHRTIFEEPYIQRLAEELKLRVDKALRK